MATIPGTISLTGIIAPPDDTDTFPVHEDTWGKGGWRSVDTITDRNNVPSQRRKAGMMVYCADEKRTYRLNSDLTTWAIPFSENMYNVMDYGAVGDGVTDDGAAFMLAVNAANTAGGGTVFFPFTITGYLVGTGGTASPGSDQRVIDLTDMDNITLLGDSRVKIKMAPQFYNAATYHAYIVWAADAKNIHLHNLTFDTDMDNQPNSGDGYSHICPVQIWTSSNITCTNCEIIGGVSETFYIFSKHDDLDETNVMFANNYVHDSGEWGWDGLGIHLDRITGAVVSDNIFENVGLRGVGLGRVRNVSVTGNYIGKNYDGGVRSVGSKRVTIAGNTIYNSNKYGIELGVTGGLYDSEDHAISGNYIYGNGANGEAGIYIWNAKNVTINANVIEEINWDGSDAGSNIGGIYLDTTGGGLVSNIAIVGNTISEIDKDYSGGLNNDPTGIFVPDDVENITMVGNIVNNCYKGLHWEPSGTDNAASANVSHSNTVADTLVAPIDLRGTGSPEGVVSAGPATTYLNISGGIDVTYWVKQNGTGNTGWFCLDDVSNFSDRIKTKSLTLLEPVVGDEVTLWFTDKALTCNQTNYIVRGSGSPQISFSIYHASTRNVAGTMVSNGLASSESGTESTTFNDSTIPADSFVWLEMTGTAQGTIDEFHITINYEED